MGNKETVILSTGVILELKEIPPMIMQEINKQAQKNKPKVPVVEIAEKGRKEENPNDPDYQRDMQLWEADLALKGIDGAILYGTSVSHVPDEIPKLEDVSWSEDIEIVGLDVPIKGKGRYLSWIKFVAAPTTEDLEILMTACTNMVGVTDRDWETSSSFGISSGT